MSLIDADKVGFERDNPVPNSHDQVIQGAVRAANTTSFNFATDASSSQQAAASFGALRIVGVSTGQAPAVTTVADGTNTYSGFAQNTYAHGLGFTPLIIAFVQVSAGEYTLMPYSEVTSASSPSGGIQSNFYRIMTDATNVYIFHYVVTYSPGIGAGTYSAQNVKYYLLQQTAT